MTADHEAFLESMADADKAVMDYLGRENLAYVSVANRLSVDCDCSADPAEPEMADIGIFASLDPVALDQACVDAVYASPDPGRAALIERMESLQDVYKRQVLGVHLVEGGEVGHVGQEAGGLVHPVEARARGGQDGPHVLAALLGLGPVSYTHLPPFPRRRRRGR